MSSEIALADMWGRVLASMEGELVRPSVDACFKGTRPVSFLDDTLVVAVPNTFALEWIQSRYLSLIRAILHGVLGRDVSVKLVVPPADQEAGAASAWADPMAPAGAVPPLPDLAVGGDPDVPVAGTLRRPIAPSLNPKYTFDSFVVGNSNRLAHAAALAVAESPARAYNPLFLYGGVGLGKTHLMQAIGHQVARRFPDLAVLYTTGETFTNELINAIRDDRTMEFKNRYRSIDILLIDDIQFIAGKERTQEEFFHTFEALHGASRQIVLSSDRPPKEIPTLEERLRSRFEWGLLADIQPPDLETRVAILRKKAQREALLVPDEVIMHIATHIHTSIRELEGALIRIVASASLKNRPVTLEIASEALRDILPSRASRPVTISDIQRAVCRHFSISLDDLRGESRARKVSLPRQIAMLLCRELTGASLPRIGEEFGGRDHTTVLHACEKISGERKTNPELEEALGAIQSMLQERQF